LLLLAAGLAEQLGSRRSRHCPYNPILPAGVIIPLLKEFEPSKSSQTYVNWDASQCLKWRYAAGIKSEVLNLADSTFPGMPSLSPMVTMAIQVCSRC
jgi:hypothetical protein